MRLGFVLALYSGKCSRCGRIYYEDHRDLVVCDCWKHCPLCEATNEPYTPDLAANVYGINGKRELLTLRVCNNTAGHFDKSPFFSTRKPVAVELT